MNSTFQLDTSTRSSPVKRTRSLYQGDPAAPQIFNAVLDGIASTFMGLAASHGWGLRIDSDTLLSIVLFADNFWLVATSPAELRSMTEAWLGLLKQAGWSAPVDEMTWCTTGEDSHTWEVRIRDQTGQCASLSQAAWIQGTRGMDNF